MKRSLRFHNAGYFFISQVLRSPLNLMLQIKTFTHLQSSGKLNYRELNLPANPIYLQFDLVRMHTFFNNDMHSTLTSHSILKICIHLYPMQQ